MAKTLSNSGITSLGTVRPGHVSQSVDALTGAEAYDITISGSLTTTGSHLPGINDQFDLGSPSKYWLNGYISNLSASNANIGNLNVSGSNLSFSGSLIMTGSSNGEFTGSFTGSFTGDGSGLTNVTAEWDGTHVGNAEITGSLIVTDNFTASNALISSSGTNVLRVIGSGSSQPLFIVSGSFGSLFEVSDISSGSIFEVNNSGGLPILQVFSNDTIKYGESTNPALITTTAIKTFSGSNTIISLPTSSYYSAVFDYAAQRTTNARSGQLLVTWNGSNIEYSETSTNDIGTVNVTFEAILSGSNVIFQANTPSAWTIRTSTKLL